MTGTRKPPTPAVLAARAHDRIREWQRAAPALAANAAAKASAKVEAKLRERVATLRSELDDEARGHLDRLMREDESE